MNMYKISYITRYDILCDKKTFLNELKNVENDENNLLYLKIIQKKDIEYAIIELLKINKIKIILNLNNLSGGLNLEKIPENIFDITNIYGLILDYNFLKEIPSSISKLVNLQILMLERNLFKSFPESICSCTKLQILMLGSCKIQFLPSSLELLKDLRELSIADNNIYEFPDVICTLKNLEILDLSHNKLSLIPNIFSNLSKLEVLKSYENLLNKFPLCICKLKNLKNLYLHDNQISNIPNEIVNMENLKLLNIDDNLFLEFPKQIFELKNLKRLNLQNKEPFEKIPFGITKLKKLKILYLTSHSFPLHLCELNLERLSIKDGVKRMLEPNRLYEIEEKRLPFRLSFLIYKNFKILKKFNYKILKNILSFNE